MVINEEILQSSFSALKNIIKDIDISTIDENELQLTVAMLKNDNRKNVRTLGDYLLKEKDKFNKEIKRVTSLYEFDIAFSKGKILAGVDEVGRGPLAGPIVAAAVILDLDNIQDLILYINDSKTLSQIKRESLSEEIKKRAISYSIAACNNEEIDHMGISYCNNKIFIDAINGLGIKPSVVLSDGYGIKNFNVENHPVIKGDSKSASIACASIIAKVYRDNLMKKYHEEYPNYDFISNVGYGSQKHIAAIKSSGVTPIHRKSFLKNIL